MRNMPTTAAVLRRHPTTLAMTTTMDFGDEYADEDFDDYDEEYAEDYGDNYGAETDRATKV